MAFSTRYLAHDILDTASCLGVSLRTNPPLTIEEVVGASNLGAITNNLVFAPIKTGANAATLERNSLAYQSWDFFIVCHDVPLSYVPPILAESYPLAVANRALP